MGEMHPSSFPASDRLGTLIAAVLLPFALTQVLPPANVPLRLTAGEFFLEYSLSLHTVMTLLAAGITATGIDWLIRSHPAFTARQTLEHWPLPTLTTLAIGIPLAILPEGLSWWLALGIAALLLVMVFSAEYITVDPTAPAYAVAAGLLTALSFAIFLILVSTLRVVGPRLILFAPAILIAGFLVPLRALRLRLQRWEVLWSLGIALILMQLASALHYWPLRPIQHGLALLGVLYALTSLAVHLHENLPVRRAALEPILVLLLVGMAILVIR